MNIFHGVLGHSPNHLHYARARLGRPAASGHILELGQAPFPVALGPLGAPALDIFSRLADSDAFITSIQMNMTRCMRLQTLAFFSA